MLGNLPLTDGNSGMLATHKFDTVFRGVISISLRWRRMPYSFTAIRAGFISLLHCSWYFAISLFIAHLWFADLAASINSLSIRLRTVSYNIDSFPRYFALVFSHIFQAFRWFSQNLWAAYFTMLPRRVRDRYSLAFFHVCIYILFAFVIFAIRYRLAWPACQYLKFADASRDIRQCSRSR